MLGNSLLIRGVFSKYLLPVCGFSSRQSFAEQMLILIKFSLSVTCFKDGGIGVMLYRLLSSRFV